MSGGRSPAMRASADPRGIRGALVVLTSLFFMWGLITSLNDILVPHLKAAFALDYLEAMLIQLSFFGAYFVMSYPSGYLVEARGYKQGILCGLAAAAAGCALFYPAAALRSYPFFLCALFVLASGITLLQVAANPYVAILGPRRSASSRLTLSQAFNSLGTTIGPYLGSLLILSGAAASSGASAALAGAGAAGRAAASATMVEIPYLALAGVLLVIAAIVALSPLPSAADIAGTVSDGSRSAAAVRSDPASPSIAPSQGTGISRADVRRSVWSYRHLVLGAIGIFVYVGGEVSIGSFLVSFMGQKEIAALPAAVAGKYLSLYWGGAMIGRFAGSALMLRVKPANVLACNAIVVALLIATAIASAGHAAMWCLLAVGLFNSIMFPTIFALALDGLGELAGEGSGVLCMAIVGGAIVPVLQGWLADSIGILHSFAAPLACYLYIAFYGLKGYRGDSPALVGGPSCKAP